jgi:hypothetical protein
MPESRSINIDSRRDIRMAELAIAEQTPPPASETDSSQG